ncbi:hypothetical protein SDC9_125087 [bioreactor metagenome]|uniref:Uncharacterized protein n=1 Tax=bioreactor metagenome TaxID=1076179 RepID=A0A645CME5_9ZZZZ
MYAAADMLDQGRIVRGRNITRFCKRIRLHNKFVPERLRRLREPDVFARKRTRTVLVQLDRIRRIDAGHAAAVHFRALYAAAHQIARYEAARRIMYDDDVSAFACFERIINRRLPLGSTCHKRYRHVAVK